MTAREGAVAVGLNGPRIPSLPLPRTAIPSWSDLAVPPRMLVGLAHSLGTMARGLQHTAAGARTAQGMVAQAERVVATQSTLMVAVELVALEGQVQDDSAEYSLHGCWKPHLHG